MGSRWAATAGPVALHLKNHQFKLYEYKYKPLVGWRRVFFVVAVNTNKDDTTFELLYKLTDETTWHAVTQAMLNPWIAAGYFKMTNMDDWEQATKMVPVDGHFVFKYSTEWLRNHLGSISIDRMGCSLLGKWLYQWDNLFAYSVTFPSVKSVSDAKEVRSAFERLGLSLDIIKDSTYHKQGLLSQIEKTNGMLEKLDGDLQNIMEQSADAMNLLSEKYGVEV